MAGTGSSRPPMSIASTPSVGTNPPRPRIPPKNTVGQKQDIGWKQGDLIDGNPNGSKCKYCKKVFSSGGVYRLKHHLACTKCNVIDCRSVPDDVRDLMWSILAVKQQKLVEKRDPTPPESDEVNSVEQIESGKRKKVDMRQPQITNMFKRGISSQKTLNSAFKRKEKEQVDKDVAEYFYDNAIPFNVAKNDKWRKMVKSIAAYGPGYEPPSYHDIRDLVYVMVNGKLRKSKNERRKRSLDIEDIDDDWIIGDNEEGEGGDDFVNLDEELMGDVEGNNSGITNTLMDELDVNVDNQEDDGDDGEEGYGGEDHNVDHVGDPNEGIDYGAYDDDINEDEEDDIMGDVPNITMNDLI